MCASHRSPRLSEDGPGAMAFGDTVRLLGITESAHGEVVVTFRVFGSYVEVEFLSHKHGLKPHIPSQRSERDLSFEQEEYVCACATLAAGMFLGWFPDRIDDVLDDT